MNRLSRPAVRDWVTHAAVLAGMCLLTAILLWPLTRHISGTSPRHDDAWMDAWTTWWMRQALWEHPQNPFFAPNAEYPIGAEMYWHNLEPAKTAWGVVLVPLFGPVTTRNLLIWTTFPLAGYTAWLLVRYVLERDGASRRLANAAAFAGATVFAFSRYHLCHADAHLNLSAIEGLPLYLFFFIRFLDGGRTRDLAALAITGLYTALCDYYYVTYAALFSALWVVAECGKRRGFWRWRSWATPTVYRAAAAGAATVVALMPVLLVLWRHANPRPLSPNHGDADFNADLASYLLPDRLSVWLTAVKPQWRAMILSLPGNNEENGNFLGYLTPLLALIAAKWRCLRDGNRWLAFGLVFFLLSLGVELSLGASTSLSPWVVLLLMTAMVAMVPDIWRSPLGRDALVWLGLAAAGCYFLPVTANGAPIEARLTMPYAVFKTLLPFYSRAGMADRFVLGATLALAVLFGGFAARVASRCKNASIAVAVALAFAIIPCTEYRGTPMALEPVTFPAVFDTIRNEPPDVAVLTDASGMSMLEQTYHHHPISYARLARVPVRQDVFESEHRLYQLAHSRGTGPVSAAERAQLKAFLHDYKFRYYIAHFFDPMRDRFIVQELGGKSIYQASDGSRYVYKLDP
jgi:hypothetical protein